MVKLSNYLQILHECFLERTFLERVPTELFSGTDLSINLSNNVLLTNGPTDAILES